MPKIKETTTLEVERDALRDAMKGAIHYINQRMRFIMTDGERREMNHITGLFYELVDEIAEQEANDHERY